MALSPNLVLKPGKIPEDLLVFSLHLYFEEIGINTALSNRAMAGMANEKKLTVHKTVHPTFLINELLLC